METKIKLSKYFDKVFLLNLAEREDRLSGMLEQIENIFDIKDIIINRTCIFPHNKPMMRGLQADCGFKFTKPNEVGCAMEHYKMVKTAYLTGSEHILIMEDDLCFYKNFDYIKESLDNMPEDYDIIQFGGFSGDEKIRTTIIYKSTMCSKHNYKNNNCFITSSKTCEDDKTNLRLWCTSMYALSRKGMQYYIAYMDKAFSVADMPLYMAADNSNLVNHYIAITPLVIQTSKKYCQSDIRDEYNDSIDYDNKNYYEYCSKDSYIDPWKIKSKENPFNSENVVLHPR